MWLSLRINNSFGDSSLKHTLDSDSIGINIFLAGKKSNQLSFEALMVREGKASMQYNFIIKEKSESVSTIRITESDAAFSASILCVDHEHHCLLQNSFPVHLNFTS